MSKNNTLCIDVWYKVELEWKRYPVEMIGV